MRAAWHEDRTDDRRAEYTAEQLTLAMATLHARPTPVLGTAHAALLVAQLQLQLPINES